MLLQFNAGISAIAPQSGILRVEFDCLGVQVGGFVEVMVLQEEKPKLQTKFAVRTETHALKKALFASALTFAASCFASSVTSFRLRASNAGEGGVEVAGVLGDGEESPD